MRERVPKFVLPTVVAVSCLLALWAAVVRPSYFNNSDELGLLVFLQVLLATIWNYRVRFFPLLLMVFLWAGMVVPMSTTWTSGRWLVLAVGALAGLLLSRDHQQRFGLFHLLALFCVVAAMISAAVSSYPTLAFLKAMSLLILFAYGSSGARLAVIGREARFFSGLLLGCEWLVYVAAIAYFVFKLEIFGNPNSLGAVMGVVAVPILLWGVLASHRALVRRRLAFACCLSLLLLFSSYARAGIAAAAVCCILLCVALRQYGVLLKGSALAVLLAAFVMTTVPLHHESSDSLTSVFLYKGHREGGILASRRPAWDDTVLAIQEHPWFGSGFGTSPTSYEVIPQPGNFESLREATREHGNSYLAITEWMGFAGDVPFFALVVIVLVNVIRALAQMRQT